LADTLLVNTTVPVRKTGSLAGPPSCRVVHLEVTDSTNMEVKRRAKNGEREGLVVFAERQTDGRGRRGRRWESPPGSLYASILVDVPSQRHRAAQLSFIGVLALLDALDNLLKDEAESPVFACKWPNDVLVHGAKVSGFLLESIPETDQIVLGLGVNIKSVSVLDALYPVTCLTKLGLSVLPEELLMLFLVAFEKRRADWVRRGFKYIRRDWLKRAYGLGQDVSLRLPGETLTGCFEGMDAEGAILIRKDGMLRQILAGDLFFQAGN